MFHVSFHRYAVKFLVFCVPESHYGDNIRLIMKRGLSRCDLIVYSATSLLKMYSLGSRLYFDLAAKENISLLDYVWSSYTKNELYFISLLQVTMLSNEMSK